MSPKAFRLVDVLGEPDASRQRLSQNGEAPENSADIRRGRRETTGNSADIRRGHRETTESSADLQRGHRETLENSAGLQRERREATVSARHHATPTAKKRAAEAEDDPFAAALTKAVELLGYGAMSPRRLSQKLTQRGYAADTVEAVITYLSEHGLLSETQDAVRFAEQGVRKLWGPRRIKEDLYARRFSEDAIADAMETLQSVDFDANCAKVIAKKYGCVPETPAEIKKMTAALMRLGYSLTQIKAAVRLVEHC